MNLYTILMLSLVVATFGAFMIVNLINYYKRRGSEQFEYNMFRRAIKKPYFTWLNEGFETYYLQIKRVTKEDLEFKSNNMSSNISLKEQKTPVDSKRLPVVYFVTNSDEMTLATFSSLEKANAFKEAGQKIWREDWTVESLPLDSTLHWLDKGEYEKATR